MKFLNSTEALQTANNVLFGLSLISGFLMAFQDSPAKSGAAESIRNAASYTWMGFLALWVVSMLIGFVGEILKKEGWVLLNTLRVSCAVGALHVCLVPVMYVF